MALSAGRGNATYHKHLWKSIRSNCARIRCSGCEALHAIRLMAPVTRLCSFCGTSLGGSTHQQDLPEAVSCVELIPKDGWMPEEMVCRSARELYFELSRVAHAIMEYSEVTFTLRGDDGVWHRIYVASEPREDEAINSEEKSREDYL